jgi:phosphoribosylformylglycinamidine cyclo-ligase
VPRPAEQRRYALAALLSEIRHRPSSSRGLPGIGHYAGLVRSGAGLIALTTDTVGTKVILAERLDRWEEVGEDLVSINVNDLAAVGARPLGLVDSLSIASSDAPRFRALGRGINRGLRAADCALLGGETAIVPDLVRHSDLGATAVGDFPAGRRPITGHAIRVGDLVVGLRANGFHSNGYTLIREVLRRRRVDIRARRPGARRPLGEELLQPTRSYARATEALSGHPGVHGFAHISGGGVRNLVRIRSSVRFLLEGWPAPRGLYRWIEQTGRLRQRRLYETFNMGIGFVVVIDPAAWKGVKARLVRARYGDARVVGRVARGSGVELPQFGLRYEGYA